MLVLKLIVRCKNCGAIMHCLGHADDQKALNSEGAWPSERLPLATSGQSALHPCHPNTFGFMERIGFRVVETTDADEGEA
jgi:hypothetical protein